MLTHAPMKFHSNMRSLSFHPPGPGTRGRAVTHLDLGKGVEVREIRIWNIPESILGL